MSDTSGPWDQYKEGINVQAATPADPGISVPFQGGGGDFRPSSPSIWDKLGQTWPVRLAKSAYNAAMLPGDVYSGKTQVFDPATGHVAQDVIGRSADLAGALTLGSGAAPAAANDLRMGIKAYHGSPHDFEKFDTSKIGTGEGAQAYGHGLYFAESPNVANEYKRALVNPDKMTIDGIQVNNPTSVEQALARYGGNVDAFVNAMQPRLADAAKKLANASRVDEGLGITEHDIALQDFNAVNKTIADAKTYAGRKFGSAGTGKTYEVSINAHPDEFLDWDAPLSQQTPQVRNALEKVYGEATTMLPNRVMQGKNGRWYTMRDDTVVGHFDGWPEKDVADYALKTMKDSAIPNYTVGEWIKTMQSPVGASEKLNAAGIKGIRYKDAGSRGSTTWSVQHPQGGVNEFADEQSARAFLARNPESTIIPPKPGTHNYVVFDDKTISILKKYGIAGLTAGLGSAAALTGKPSQAEAAPAGPWQKYTEPQTGPWLRYQ